MAPFNFDDLQYKQRFSLEYHSLMALHNTCYSSLKRSLCLGRYSLGMRICNLDSQNERRKFVSSYHDDSDSESNSDSDSDSNFSYKGEMVVGNRLVLSDEVIEKRKPGIVVFKGTHEGRPVAVKRIAWDYYYVAKNEINHLILSDNHPNVIRFFGSTHGRNFIYLSLELCGCNLYDLVQKQMYSYLWRSNGYPSSDLLSLMKGIVVGLAHLHRLSIIRTDLEPHNTLIVEQEGLIAKLCGMGNTKCIATGVSSLGCNPDEDERQTSSKDMFNLGLVLFFCITRGGHPFLEHNINVANGNKMDLSLLNHIPEALNLISRLLDPRPELRPKASSILHHPLFWNSLDRMSFLRQVSDRVKSEPEEVDSIVALESIGPLVFNENWGIQINKALTSYKRSKYTYDHNKVRHLLRYIRNIYSHYIELPLELKKLLVSDPEGIDDYFRSRFPKLFMEVFKVMLVYYGREDWFQTYLKK